MAWWFGVFSAAPVLLLLALPGLLLCGCVSLLAAYRRGNRRGGVGRIGDGDFPGLLAGVVALQAVEDDSHGAADVVLGVRGEFLQ